MNARTTAGAAAGWLALFFLVLAFRRWMEIALGAAALALLCVFVYELCRRWTRRARAAESARAAAAADKAGPLAPWASARVDQHLARRRAETGDQGPDYAAFVDLMRSAGAGDLEGGPR